MLKLASPVKKGWPDSYDQALKPIQLQGIRSCQSCGTKNTRPPPRIQQHRDWLEILEKRGASILTEVRDLVPKALCNTFIDFFFMPLQTKSCLVLFERSDNLHKRKFV